MVTLFDAITDPFDVFLMLNEENSLFYMFIHTHGIHTQYIVQFCVFIFLECYTRPNELRRNKEREGGNKDKRKN